MSSAEVVIARYEILAALFRAKPNGLTHTELVKVCKTRAQLTNEKEIKRLLENLCSGGASRNPPNVKKRGGKYHSTMIVAPTPVTLVNENPTGGDKRRAKFVNARDQILNFLLANGGWVSKQALLDVTPYCSAKLLNTLLDEKLVTRIGATKSTRYSLTVLKLDPPSPDKGVGQVPRAVVLHPKAVPAKLERAIAKVRAALEELESAAKAA